MSEQDSPGGSRTSERVMNLVARVLEHPPGAAPLPTAVRMNELGMSSMKMINLMLAIEVEFDLTIPQAEITPDNFDTIGSVESMVARLLRSAGGS